MVTVNVVVLAGSVAADPVQRRMPSGDEVTELRLSVPEAGKRLLPLPIAAWHATVGVQALDGIGKGDRVLVHGLTALGNVTNTAARLTSIARGGEIIVDTETYAAVAELYPEAEPRELELKGKRV